MDARSLIPGYEITATLSDHGGQAVVYQAKQLSVARLPFAIKVYRARVRTERDRLDFLREVNALKELAGHHNVVRLTDANIINGVAYLVMELCQGSLADQLRVHGPLSPQRVVDVARRVCNALAAAHARGILHRDLKPSNLLVTAFGEVVVADFGIAALSAPRSAAAADPAPGSGTPGYLAPELLSGGRPTPQSDVYALGATLYTLLYGSSPLSGQRLADPEIPRPLAEVIDRSLDPDPARRFASVAELSRILAPTEPAVEPATVAGPRTIVDPGRPDSEDDLEELWLSGIDSTRTPKLRPEVVKRDPSPRIPQLGWGAAAGAAGLVLLLGQLTVASRFGYVAGAVAVGLAAYALLRPKLRRLRQLVTGVLVGQVATLSATAGYLAVSQPPQTGPAVLAGLAAASLTLAYGCQRLNSWQVSRAQRQRKTIAWHWDLAKRAEVAFENSGRPPSWLARLLALPAVRLYRFDHGPLEYAAACGSRVVAFAVVRWHRGSYVPMATSPHVARNDQPYRQGAAEMHAILNAVPGMRARLGPYAKNSRIYVVITRDDLGGDGVSTPGGQAQGGVVFTTPQAVTDQVGTFLAEDGYHIDVELTRILLRLAES